MANKDPAKIDKIRLDKWLVYARFVKTRDLAGKLATKGKVRINGRKIDKPDAFLRVGDVLTLVLNDDVHVIEIVALGERRGPASEARQLYNVLNNEYKAGTEADEENMI